MRAVGNGLDFDAEADVDTTTAGAEAGGRIGDVAGIGVGGEVVDEDEDAVEVEVVGASATAAAPVVSRPGEEAASLPLPEPAPDGLKIILRILDVELVSCPPFLDFGNEPSGAIVSNTP